MSTDSFLPPPFEYGGRESDGLHHAELPDSNAYPRSYYSHTPFLPFQTFDRRSVTVNKLNNACDTTMPTRWTPSLTLVGPGRNPDPLPHPEPSHPASSDNAPNYRKRKRTTPPHAAKPSSTGGYGPVSPISPGTHSTKPSPPPSAPKRRRNAADDVRAFTQPLASHEEPRIDQWPTSLEPNLAGKPKSAWFGCKLCLRTRCVIHPSALLGGFHMAPCVVGNGVYSEMVFPQGLHQPHLFAGTLRTAMNFCGCENA